MINADILTEDELCPIADYHTRGGLKAWLRGNCIPFVEARSGWPRVHRKALEQAFGVKGADAPKVAAPIEFDFDSLR